MFSFFPLAPVIYFGIRLSVIDLQTHRLPNRLVAWFAASEALILGFLSWVSGDFGRMINALGVATATLGIYLVLFLLSRGAFGMGDVKFAFPLGLCIGWFAPELWLTSILVALLIAGLVAVIGILFKKINRNTAIAFGPFMFAGTLLSLLLDYYLIRSSYL